MMAKGPNNNPIIAQNTGLPSSFFAINRHTSALAKNTVIIIRVTDMMDCMCRKFFYDLTSGVF